MASIPRDADANLQHWVERLAEAATTGTMIDLADGLACDPASADQWSPGRTLPAAAIREILTRRDLPVDPRGLQIRGARIIGDIDLAYVAFNHPLHLTECRIDGKLKMEHIVLKELRLTGTHSRDINLDLAEINGDIYADKGCTVNGELCLTAANIKSQLILTRATLANPGGNALLLDGATIANGLLANAVKTDGCFRAPRVHIDGGLFLNGAILNNPAGAGALILLGGEITGNMAARQMKVEGAISAERARVGGWLDLGGATLTNRGGVVLDVSEATIGANLKLSGGFTAIGEVKLLAAHIGGDFEANSAVLYNAGGTALRLTRAAIAGSLRGSRSDAAEVGLRMEGELLAENAQIGGQVDLRGAHLANADRRRPVTLNLDSAKIAAGVHLPDMRCDGMFLAFGARIGGPLELTKATFSNGGNADPNVRYPAVALEGAEITGAVTANQCKIEGGFFLPKAQIQSEFRLYGAMLSNPGGVALNLDGAELADDLIAREDFKADGRISAVGARIAALHISDAALNADGVGVAMRLERAQIGELNFESAIGGINTDEPVDGVIDLTRAVIGRLKTAENGPAPGSLVATGWEIADVAGGLRDDRSARQWLKTAPADSESVQPWHGLAAVYERNGDFAGARRLRLGAADRVTEKSRWPTKILRTVYRLVVGHGYYPLWAAYWLALIVLAGVLMVQLNLGTLVPTKPGDAQSAYTNHNHAVPPPSITAQTPCGSLGDYPCVHPIVYTVSSIIPTVASNPNSDWTIRSPWINGALIVLKSTAWILTALLLAGVTGLLRKT